MKNFFVSILFCWLLFYTAYSQNTSLLSEISMSVGELNPEQIVRYQKLTQNPMYHNFHFVEVNPLSEVEDDGRVSINLPYLPCPQLTFQLSRGSYTDDMNYGWYGKEENEASECTMTNLTILGLGNEYIGNLTFNEKSFELFDLTGGVRLLCESNLSQTKESECGMRSYEPQPVDEPPMQPFAACEVVKTRVLVLYTDAAEAIEPNIYARANLAISQTNSAFANSQVFGIGTPIELADVVPFNFTETFDISTDIDSLASNPTAQSLRSQFNADLVVLFTNGDYPNLFGITKEIGPIFNSSFAIVQVSSSTSGRFTFAHELAHLFGARHNGDPAGGFAHGYIIHYGFLGIFGPKQYTIMANLPINKSRISHYSNPNVSFMGKATGTSANNDNARQIEDAAPTVGAFFTETSGLSVSFNENSENVDDCVGGPLQVSADVKCGIPNYSYVWYRSTNNITWTQIGTGVSANIAIAAAPNNGSKTTFYRVVVTDAIGASVTKNGSYTAYCEPEPCPGCPKRTGQFTPREILSISPNPTEGETMLTLKNEFDGIVNIEVVNTNGSVVMCIDNAYHTAGELSYNLTNHRLPSGLYFVRASGQNFTTIQKLVIIK